MKVINYAQDILENIEHGSLHVIFDLASRANESGCLCRSCLCCFARDFLNNHQVDRWQANKALRYLAGASFNVLTFGNIIG